MADLPTGTVTFLFTDIEGSSQLWERYPEAMKAALARHDALLRDAIAAQRGHVVKGRGDGFHAAFETAMAGVSAALAAQRSLWAEAWDELKPHALCVRMGLHTGEAEARAGDYFGPALNRAARVQAIASGGQILLSLPTVELIRDELRDGVTLQDLGEHRLKDLNRPERIFQLTAPGLPASFPALKSLNAFPNNLPLQLTSFVGRGRELNEVKTLLSQTRLLTLTGPGGTGKTRLSLQLAAESLSDFADGAWLIELAPLADPALILPAIASAFNLRELPGRGLPAIVLDFLREKSLLLILDNCEHLVEACARLSDELLRACPRLRIIASSREGLGIAGETTYRIPPLSLPPDFRSLADFESLEHSEAIQLFVERARAALPGFRLNEMNASAISQICSRLDGIPLAIELAAARVRLFSAEQIAGRLNDRFRLLVGGSRTALPRQQTLQALMDWSYDLLFEDERQLLRALSVFAGGWTFEAAEAIAPDLDVLTLLMHLVDKSLVLVEEAAETHEARYRFLETIRQYARDKLFEAQEAAPARDRHFAIFTALAEEAWENYLGAELITWRDKLIQELDNLRAALEWGLDQHPEDALNLIANVASLWGFEGNGLEARRWLVAARQRVESLPSAQGDAAVKRQHIRAKAYYQEGALAMAQGDNLMAVNTLAKAITLARAVGDKRVLGYSLSNWSVAASFTGKEDNGEAAQEALVIMREVGDKAGQGLALIELARVFMLRGELDRRSDYADQAMRLFREAQIPFLMSMTLMGLGMDATMRGNHELARKYFTESLDLFQKQKNKLFATVVMSELGHLARRTGDSAGAIEIYKHTLLRWKDFGQRAAIAHQLECFAFISSAQEQFERAARLLGAAEALRESLGAPMMKHEQLEYEREIAALRAQMDATALSAAWAEGRSTTTEQAIEYALEETPV